MRPPASPPRRQKAIGTSLGDRPYRGRAGGDRAHRDGVGSMASSGHTAVPPVHRLTAIPSGVQCAQAGAAYKSRLEAAPGSFLDPRRMSFCYAPVSHLTGRRVDHVLGASDVPRTLGTIRDRRADQDWVGKPFRYEIHRPTRGNGDVGR